MRTGIEAAWPQFKGADGQHDAWIWSSALDRPARLCRTLLGICRRYPMGTRMSAKQKAVATRQLAAVAATAIALAVFDHDGVAGLRLDRLTTGSILDRSVSIVFSRRASLRTPTTKSVGGRCGRAIRARIFAWAPDCGPDFPVWRLAEGPRPLFQDN